MTGPVLVVPFASSVKNLGQLNGKEIAVIQGSSNALILEKNPEIIAGPKDLLKAFNEGLEKLLKKWNL